MGKSGLPINLEVFLRVFQMFLNQTQYDTFPKFVEHWGKCQEFWDETVNITIS